MTSGDAAAAGPGTHRLPRFVFDQFLTGAVSSAGIAFLRKGQYSLRRLKLRVLADAAAELAHRLGPFADVDAAWRVLAEVERSDAAVVEDVLLYPSVGVWLSRALRHVLGGIEDPTPMWSEVGGFHALAAAAAVRGGVPCELAVPVVHGSVALPSVGLFRLSTGFPVGHARLRNTATETVVTAFGSTSPARFEPVKRYSEHRRGHRVRVVFDDLDPYRGFGGPKAADPLDDNEYDQWRKLMGEAWDLLTAHHSRWAEELSATLATVIPLSAEHDVFAASSSAAFGGIAMSPKRSATEFAEALVHEVQHSKVNALLDLVDLHHGDETPRYYAPWRDDPRPVVGMLHGIYAFISVVEFWNAQRGSAPPALARRAHYAFGLRAHQVGQAVRTLLAVEGLTGLGREFVTAVADRLAACGPVELPGELAATVEAITTEHRGRWRVRHVRPEPAVVAELADAWLSAGSAFPVVGPDHVVLAPSSGGSRLGELLKRRAMGTDRLDFGDGPDSALARGDRRGAVEGYAALIRAAPHEEAAWVGLGLALGSTALRRTPEVVRAVHLAATRSGAAPDPVELAAWFDRTAS
ncbi:HEXXH motif domain-containing protein [Saccharothrix coeruleofusca]|uniref:HEXXH motif domain-containing protein n=1 Tax=Saccharothrix coeruleofusca TaxID=33919 RepID=A0A918AU01_9PSEU|nr:HEXXH motif domain-containing protein [Saccharothrix coeruleofusca]GGP84418.1 HEXXH motif domain-containing protein [Saccharothrix coeruleofusca]